MWELSHKEGWEAKNWCVLIGVLEKTLESPLDSKEIKQVNPKENQPWIFIERTNAEAEAPILWPPDIKSQLIWKDPDARKDWSQEKGMTEEEMVGWHHWLSGHGKSRWRGRYYLKTLSWSAYGPLFSESMTLSTPGWVDWQFSLRSPKSGSTGCLSRKRQWSRSRLLRSNNFCDENKYYK